MDKHNSTLEEVYSGTPWEAGMVSSLLENSGVHAFLKDEIMGTLNPWVAAPGGAGAVKVYVASHHVEKAKHIAGEYERNLKE